MPSARANSSSVVVLLVVAGVYASCGTRVEEGPLIARGDALMEKKDYLQAAGAYAAASQAHAAASNGVLDGQILLKLADAYLRADKIADAYKQGARAADLLPDNVGAQIMVARLALRAEEFDEASSRASKALAKDPNSVDAHIELGNAAAHLRTTTVAFVALGGNPEADSPRLWRGLRRGSTPAQDVVAEETFRKALALETDPKAVKARMALANFLWATGRADEAGPLLKQVADGHPDDVMANQALGDFYVLRKRDAEGEQYLERAAALPDGAGARRRLYNLYSRAKRTDEAAALLASMLATDDASGGVSLRLARIEFDAGKRDDAVRRLDPLLSRTPPVPGATVLKAQFLLSLGDPEQAITFARKGVGEDSRSAEARATLSSALSAVGNLEDAYDERAEAVRLNPTDVESLLEFVRLSFLLGRTDAAATAAREALRLAPDNHYATVALARALILAKDYAGADKVLKPLVATARPSSDVLVQLGALEEGRGNDAAARAAFTRALQAATESLDALSGIVLLDLKQKRTADARRRVEEAVARYPRDAGYLELAARVYAAAEDASRAEATLRQVLDLDPTNVSAAIALARAIALQHPQDARRVLERLLERRPHATEAWAALKTMPEVF